MTSHNSKSINSSILDFVEHEPPTHDFKYPLEGFYSNNFDVTGLQKLHFDH